jgi:hypothetical protein
VRPDLASCPDRAVPGGVAAGRGYAPLPVATSYRYELWEAGVLVSTGRLTREEQFVAGGEVTIGTRRGVVREVAATVLAQELRLVVDLLDR